MAEQETVLRKIKQVFQQTAFVKAISNLNGSYFFAVVLDFIYYLLFLLVGSFFMFRVYPKVMQIQQAITAVQSQEGLAALSTLFGEFKAYSLLVVVFIILNYIILKWLIWKVLLNEKIFSEGEERTVQTEKTLQRKIKILFKDLTRFAGVTLLVLIFVAIFLLLGFLIAKQETFGYLVTLFYLPLLIYLLLFAHPLAVQKKSFKEACKATFKVTIANVHRLFFPYLLMVILFFIWLYVLQLFLFLPIQMYLVLYLVGLSLFFNACKVYAKELIEKIQTKGDSEKKNEKNKESKRKKAEKTK